ncbi:MAG: VCBS domain-containing protein [Patescibacteria group bacterium]
MENQKSVYTQYAEVDKQIKDLQEKQKILQVECLVEMEKRKATQIKTDLGIFSVAERRTWTYSADLKKEETNIKALKKAEEISGKATCEISKSMRFLKAKE